MTEGQAWREIAQRYADHADYSLWLRVYDLFTERRIDHFTYRTMVVRIESHMKLAKKFWPAIDGCLAALFLALESEE